VSWVDRSSFVITTNFIASDLDALFDDVVTWLAVGSKLAIPEQPRVAVVLDSVMSNRCGYG
jgi:hypothetical protein